MIDLLYGKISGFSDEISSEIITQFEILNKLKIKYFEPRGINGKSIAALTDDEVAELKAKMDECGIKASSIGSPVGKVKITDDLEKHFELYKRIVAIAKSLETKYIRMFSFYIDENEDYDSYRDEVFERLEKMADYARKEGIWCCHENEKGIFGDNDVRCLDILKTFEGKIKGIFDPANFIQCKVEILPAFEKLKDYIEYMHIKDRRMSDGFVVPCGKGDGNIEELIRRFNKIEGKHFLTLEPHLKVFEGLKDLELTGGAESVKEEYEYPTNRDAFNAACKAFKEVYEAAAQDSVKSTLTVEISAGQMVEDVRLAVNGKKNVEFLGQPGSIVPTPEEIAERILEMRRA